MTNAEVHALRDQAALLFQHLNGDIQNALTRNEHIRLTAHAAEAERLVYALSMLLDENAA